MQVTPLNVEWENRFWKYVNQDPIDYYFFIFDWKYKKDQTQIYLAIDVSEAISGLMLIYRNHTIQIRGTPKATKILLDSLKEKSIELTVPLNCKEQLLQKYPSFSFLKEITLMCLPKGTEKVQITKESKLLGLSDAEAIAILMQKTNPCHWANCTSEILQSLFNETIWIGIKDQQILASLGVATSIEGESHIMFITTHEKYRNRGYATSIVSMLVNKIFEKSQTAIIYVVSNNKPAISVYSKIGFQPHKVYLFIKT